MQITKAVIPAAGLGTRFLPATKSQPKEMIPLIDKPGIQYVVEEAVRAGLQDILIVTGRGKVALEDHFDRSLELERALEDAGKSEELAVVREVADMADLYFVRQKEPLGLGHAVTMARAHCGDEPFVVMLGDELIPEPAGGELDLLPRLIEIHGEVGASVIAVQEVAPEDVSHYGIIAPKERDENPTRIADMVEKPAPGDAPSNLASRGRYVFTPEIFDALDRTEPGYGGEIQLTDAIRSVAQEGAVYAYVHEGPIYDAGKKLDYLRATVQLAMRRDDLAKPFSDFLKQFVAELE